MCFRIKIKGNNFLEVRWYPKRKLVVILEMQ
jgi:hypothetical protein